MTSSVVELTAFGIIEHSYNRSVIRLTEPMLRPTFVVRRKLVLPSFRGPCSGAGFRVSGGPKVTLFAYLDEFRHNGPSFGRVDSTCNLRLKTPQTATATTLPLNQDCQPLL